MLENFEQGIGLSIVAFFNQFYSPGFAWLWQTMHFIGSEQGSLILLPLIYWCTCKRTGINLLLLVLCSTLLMSLLKGVLARPRPFVVSPETITAHVTEHGYGLPSGHTMFATVFGGWFALNYAGILRLFGVVFILMMGVSRMVLGVHYPQDVVLGLCIGIALLYLYTRYHKTVLNHVTSLSSRQQLVFSCVVFFLLFSLGWLSMESFADRKYFFAGAGALTGACLGLLHEHRYLNFQVKAAIGTKLLRGLIGIALLTATYIVLRQAIYALPFEQEQMAFGISYQIRYTLTTYIAAFIIPLLLNRVGLMTRKVD